MTSYQRGRLGGKGRVEYLLYPEWQGYGVDPAVYHGALAMARALFPGTTFTHIESPVDEVLAVASSVLGLESIAERFRGALADLRASAPDIIVTVGGTCGVEAAPVAYLNERYGGNLAVVWFDGHGDLNSPATSPSGHFHGMVLRTLLGDGPQEYVSELRRRLTPQQLFLAGTRDLDPEEAAYIRDARISVTPPESFTNPGAVAAAVARSGATNVYLHVDLDCFAPDEIPDTLMRTPGGPPFASVAATIVELTAAFDVVGFSLVEYVDRGGETLARLSDLHAVLEQAVGSGSV